MGDRNDGGLAGERAGPSRGRRHPQRPDAVTVQDVRAGAGRAQVDGERGSAIDHRAAHRQHAASSTTVASVLVGRVHAMIVKTLRRRLPDHRSLPAGCSRWRRGEPPSWHFGRVKPTKSGDLVLYLTVDAVVKVGDAPRPASRSRVLSRPIRVRVDPAVMVGSVLPDQLAVAGQGHRELPVADGARGLVRRRREPARAGPQSSRAAPRRLGRGPRGPGEEQRRTPARVHRGRSAAPVPAPRRRPALGCPGRAGHVVWRCSAA